VKENIHPASWFSIHIQNIPIDIFNQILIILSDGWTQVNFKELIDEPFNHNGLIQYDYNMTKLMFICKQDTIIYLIANVPDIMVDLLNNKYYKNIFKIAKLKTQLREIPKVYRKKLYQIPEVFPKFDKKW